MHDVGIIGGGAAGLAAAAELSRRHIHTAVFDMSGTAGGSSKDLCCKADPVCQRCDACAPSDLYREARKSECIDFFFDTEVKDVSGTPGDYTLRTSKGDFSVRSIILASGLPIFSPDYDLRYAYSSEDVLTSRDMEVMISSGNLTVPSTGKAPESVAVIHCVGSRDAEHGVPYCSKVCCKYSLKLMKRLRKSLPETEVTFFYRDWRPSDRGYDKLSEYGKEKGIHVIRSRPECIIPGKRPVVRYSEEKEFDMVILAVGLLPPKTDLASALGLERSRYGFFLKKGTGVYPAGCCTGPKDIRESVEEGIAAAGKAAAFLGWTL